MIYAILATGQSMSQYLADYVKGKCKAIAVSDAYMLAPWADALVSNDSSWWRVHKEAVNFVGRKFCATQVKGTELIKPDRHYSATSNSGLLAMRVAEKLGATKILLLGFDLHGTHYFGPHPEPLRNTTERRFKTHIKQFDQWRGCDVVNCTPGSHLKRFQFDTIENQLEAA